MQLKAKQWARAATEQINSQLDTKERDPKSSSTGENSWHRDRPGGIALIHVRTKQAWASIKGTCEYQINFLSFRRKATYF